MPAFSSQSLLDRSVFSYHVITTMYVVTSSAFLDMIISAYGNAAWSKVELRTGMEVCEWEDSKFYPDEAFFDMIDVVVKILELTSQEVKLLTTTVVSTTMPNYISNNSC